MGEWKLSSYNAIYSFGKYYSSYQIAFKKLKIGKFPAKNVLLLGIGLGSIIKLLLEHPTIQHVSAIDIDPEIIDLAKKYWPDMNQKFNTDFFNDDAINWLETYNKDQQFDLILSDIFIDDQTPEKFLTEKYLYLIKERLSPKGMFIFSRINFTSAQQNDNADYEDTFKKVFPNYQVMPSKYNLMFITPKQ